MFPLRFPAFPVWLTGCLLPLLKCSSGEEESSTYCSVFIKENQKAVYNNVSITLAYLVLLFHLSEDRKCSNFTPYQFTR